MNLGALEPGSVVGGVLVAVDLVEEPFGFLIVLGAVHRHVGSVPRSAGVGHGGGRLRQVI